ncbi:MAG: monooxygenase [Proteobacteria bacterium SG_bin9]|nr:MAG: monooxygenase [Proteobacteria bacterium SG_bin9]
MKTFGEHAVVIGASMAGLLAARALINHFHSVTVLERDRLADTDRPRKGVPQGRHAHGLLARGRVVIEDFFPGWTDEVVASGGLLGDIGGDVDWVGHNVRLKSGPSDLIGLLAPRPALETHVRRRLAAMPGVTLIDGCSVDGLLVADGGQRICGVRAQAGGELPRAIKADLVVDAGGRGSTSPAWLKALDYELPSEDRIEIGAGYTTRSYRRKPTDLGGRLAVVIAGSAPNWRNGVILAQSEDRWIVSVGGYFGDHAPDNDEGFADYVGTLPVPDIYQIVMTAEPLSEFMTYRYAANLRRRYEKLTRFPEGYLVFGDAFCSFNPVYGQGMTVAAQEARALDECLQRGNRDLARRFFRAAGAIVDIPWNIAVGNDLRHPKVEGERPAMVRFINWYIGKLHLAARHDPHLTTAFLHVANLMAQPPSLLKPSIVARVMKGNLFRPSIDAGVRVPSRAF